jgi:hypothetical protein
LLLHISLNRTHCKPRSAESRKMRRFMKRTRHHTSRLVTRHVWIGAWLLIALSLLKLATPWVASVAAQQRGVALVEVCSVYGVRTVALPKKGVPMPAGEAAHGDSGDCVLASVLGAAGLGLHPAAVLLHAPPQAPPWRMAMVLAAPHDASRRWLAAQLHAPPQRGG